MTRLNSAASIPTRDAKGELTCHPLVERVERAELAERHGRALDNNATGERCTRDESQPKHGTAVAQAAARRKLHVPRRTRRLQSLQLPAATLMGECRLCNGHHAAFRMAAFDRLSCLPRCDGGRPRGPAGRGEADRGTLGKRRGSAEWSHEAIFPPWNQRHKARLLCRAKWVCHVQLADLALLSSL